MAVHRGGHFRTHAHANRWYWMTRLTAKHDPITGLAPVESPICGLDSREARAESVPSNSGANTVFVPGGNGIERVPYTPLQTNTLLGGQGASDMGEGRDRKKFGIYYTPSVAARILCAWAIRSPDDLVLEPSFGACGFLEAACEGLKDVSAKWPQDNLFGCDIDPEAFTGYLEPRLGLRAEDGRFFLRDFLSVQPGDFARGPFDVVVGNPPYVSYHNMDADQRATSEVAVARAGFDGGPKSSLWAHFLIYAMTFLKGGGRMAWLLPSSFLYADYAARIREHVAERFERCLVVQLGQRLFLSEGTEESTAVLLAEGYISEGGDTSVPNRLPGSILLDFAETLLELERSIEKWRRGWSEAKPFEGRAAAAYLSGEGEVGYGTSVGGWLCRPTR